MSVNTQKPKNEHGKLSTYVTGFAVSIILTFEAYILVENHSFSYWYLVVMLLGLAIVQMFIQLFFFLHIGDEKKPKWNLSALMFAGLVVLIVVIGTLWIMQNLDKYHGRIPTPSDTYIIQDEGFKQ